MHLYQLTNIKYHWLLSFPWKGCRSRAICYFRVTHMKVWELRTYSYEMDVCCFFSYQNLICFCARHPPSGAMASSCTRFLHHTRRRTTVGRTPLDEWSGRRSDLYLTTHKSHNKHPCPRWDSNPPITADERPQTYALDRAATGTGYHNLSNTILGN